MVFTHKASGTAGFQDAIQLGQDRLAALVRNFGLDDERRFVFPQMLSSRSTATWPLGASSRSRPAVAMTYKNGRAAAGIRGPIKSTEVMGLWGGTRGRDEAASGSWSRFRGANGYHS